MGWWVDGDVVVVVDPAEVLETEVARQRCGLGFDPLHQVAVATDRVCLVVEGVKIRPIATAGEPALRDGHADAGGDALSERPGGGLDARDQVVLGMTRRLAAELAKSTDVVEGDGWTTGPFACWRGRTDRGRARWVLEVETQHAVPERLQELREIGADHHGGRLRRPGTRGVRRRGRGRPGRRPEPSAASPHQRRHGAARGGRRRELPRREGEGLEGHPLDRSARTRSRTIQGLSKRARGLSSVDGGDLCRASAPGGVVALAWGSRSRNDMAASRGAACVTATT